jgi:hypothetical protein
MSLQSSGRLDLNSAWPSTCCPTLLRSDRPKQPTKSLRASVSSDRRAQAMIPMTPIRSLGASESTDSRFLDPSAAFGEQADKKATLGRERSFRCARSGMIRATAPRPKTRYRGPADPSRRDSGHCHAKRQTAWQSLTRRSTAPTIPARKISIPYRSLKCGNKFSRSPVKFPGVSEG